MPSRDRKRELKAAFKAQQRTALEAAMPLSKSALRELFAYLERGDAPACDHTLRGTLHFLAATKLDPELVLPWLHQHGGFCDCEVVLNVAETYGPIVGYEV